MRVVSEVRFCHSCARLPQAWESGKRLVENPIIFSASTDNVWVPAFSEGMPLARVYDNTTLVSASKDVCINLKMKWLHYSQPTT